MNLLVLTLALSTSVVAQEPPFVTRAEYLSLANAISGDAAYEHIRFTTQFHKPRGGSPGLMEIARYMEAKAREYGIEDVRLIRQPATNPAWHARSADLWIDAGEGAGGAAWQRVVSLRQADLHLADYSRPASVTAQIVDVGSGLDSASYAGKAIRGNLVLAWGGIGPVTALAVRRFGAAGVVNRPDPASAQALDYPDQIRWSTTTPDAFAFVLSHRQGQALAQRLAGGPRPARAVVESVLDSTDRWQVMVEGVLRGTDPSLPAIVLTGHMQEGKYSANDDGSGIANVLEIARAMTVLVQNGQLQRPRRTIRFWWVTEISSERQYFADHPDEVSRIWLNINQDMVGANQGQDVLRVQNITRLPWSRAHSLEDIAERVIDWLVVANGQQLAQAQVPANPQFWRPAPIISHLGTRHRYNAALVPFHNNTDHMTFNEAPIGIPGITFTNWPDNYIHTTDDDLWNVDRTQMERNAVAVAMMALYLARAGESDVPAIAASSLGSALRKLGDAYGTASGWLVAAADTGRAAAYHQARAQIEVVGEVAAQQVRSIGDVAGGGAAARFVTRAVAQIDAATRARLADLDQLYREIAGARAALPPAAALTADEQRLATMRPALAAGPTQYLTGRNQPQNVPGLHGLMAHEINSAVNGRRTGLDIYRLVAAQARAAGAGYYGVVTPAMVARYLDNLVTAGLVRL